MEFDGSMQRVFKEVLTLAFLPGGNKRAEVL